MCSAPESPSAFSGLFAENQLPNIYGGAEVFRYNFNDDVGSTIVNGAFSTYIQNKNADAAPGVSCGHASLYFNASQVSSIFQTDAELQAPACQALIAIRF